MRKIILTENEVPKFIGNWTVGEVLQMAQQLAGWIERLAVPASNSDEQPDTNPS